MFIIYYQNVIYVNIDLGSFQDCAPCVVLGKDGKEHLGKVIVSMEKASYAEGNFF